MKIHGPDPFDRLKEALSRLEEKDRAERTRGRNGDEPVAPGGRTGDTDQVQLSERARELRRLRDALDRSPEIREELVARLREEIASGRYGIDGRRIADGILAEEAGLRGEENGES